ncbi:MAG: hypothetical protein LW892_06640, partial [Betaproteobacteria bacterium]|nr:hypothetical protein [Betaproteobacteria bacterium]
MFDMTAFCAQDDGGSTDPCAKYLIRKYCLQAIGLRRGKAKAIICGSRSAKHMNAPLTAAPVTASRDRLGRPLR